MKKSLIIASMAASILLTTSLAFADTATEVKCDKQKSEVTKQLPSKNCPKGFKCKKEYKIKRQTLDERLNLTEEQKKQAFEIRMEGHKKIKPIFEKIKNKKAEIKTIVEDTKLSESQKEKKINAIEIEIVKLKQEARKVRFENTKQFEAILTQEQKAEFKKIKEEGKKFHRMHHFPENRPMPLQPQEK